MTCLKGLILSRMLNDDIANNILNLGKETDSILKRFYGFGTVPMQSSGIIFKK